VFANSERSQDLNPRVTRVNKQWHIRIVDALPATRSPAALDAAIGLLDRPSGYQSCGDILATGSPLQKRSMNPGG